MRRVGVVAGLALLMAGCAVTASPLVEFHDRFAPTEGPPVDVRAVLQREHARDAPRYLRAAVASLAALTPWLGPYPQPIVTLVDPPPRGTPLPEAAAIVLEPTPWWSTRSAMTPELATARGVARRFWAGVLDTSALPVWFVDGLTEYVARRVVTDFFQGENLPPGFAMLEPRYFGGFVPEFVRVRLLPESDGEPVSAYRTHLTVDVTSRSPADARALTAKAVVTLNTLERWVSRPVLDGAIAEFVRRFRGERPTLKAFADAVSDASGQDLSWLFVQTFAGSAVFDYAVQELATSPAGGGFDTTVVVARVGDGVFSGTTAPRVGPFESGRGMTLRVSFADGQQIDDQWDGRDARKTFTYRGPSRAVSATLDPARVLVLDVQRTNNGRTLRPRASTAASRWAARWSLWLETVLLTYGFLV